MHKLNGSVRAAIREQPANEKLGIGTNRRPSPNVTGLIWRGLGLLYVTSLGVNEAPDFIHLDSLARKVAKRLVLIGGASVASRHKQFCHRVLAGPGQPGHG